MAISKIGKVAILVVALVVIVVAVVIPVTVLTRGHTSQNATASSPTPKSTPSTTSTPTSRATQPQQTTQPPATTRSPTVKPTQSVGQCGTATAAAQSCAAVQDVDRHNCFPDEGANESKCQQRGCCWRQPTNSSMYPNIPMCFYPANYASYVVEEQTQTSFGWRLKLQRCRLTPVMFAEPVDRLSVEIQFQQSNRLRVKIMDADNQRYQVPIPLPEMKDGDQAATNRLYDLEVTASPFSFRVIRKETKAVIFDSGRGGLRYENQFLQISSKLPSRYFYGLGEHEHRQFLHNNFNWKAWPLFTKDEFPTADLNLYGVHPFYLNIEDNDARSNAVLFYNSNAMEIIVSPAPAITYRTIGGIMDFIIFVGPDPATTNAEYIKTIGLPYFQPYWALGFQLCRWGYMHIDVVKQVLDEMRQYDIPQDIQYGDIDYMRHRLDFTYDEVRFKGLPEFVNELHDQGLHYIIILDPAISDNQTKGTYPPFDKGQEMGVWVNDSRGGYLVGKVWPRGNASFPDYTNPITHQWWEDLIIDFHKVISYDGLWIDMNEPANFVAGSQTGCPTNKWNFPPYRPRSLSGEFLFTKTLCMDARQHWSDHYNVHSLYGYSETEPTLIAARKVLNKRSMVLSRSTFVGSGKFTGHWLGDNNAWWSQLAYSIIGSLEFGMFGFSYVGADICGFFGNSTGDLCNRWMQLGAFYPFSRNHNAENYAHQHPTKFGPEVAANSRNVLLIRYRLLPYLYTLMHDASTVGTTVMRSFMFEWPRDMNCRTTKTQFLWGSGLMITPVLTPNTTEVMGYIPDARWFDYRTGRELPASTRKTTQTFSAPHHYIPIHVRGGVVIPMQQPANTTMYSRRNPFELLIALDDNQAATGNLFWDDGDSIDTYQKNQYLSVSYTATKNGVTAKVNNNGYAAENTLQHILVYGLAGPINSVSAEGANVTSFRFDSTLQLLNVTGISLSMSSDWQVGWN